MNEEKTHKNQQNELRNMKKEERVNRMEFTTSSIPHCTMHCNECQQQQK